ncbi:GNAT family N-acetyltransferase [uncultured Brevibacillus sp.]|uniref:GNAT family N-acetyltransferase n=1 Tax=uncultured Brevibacillus sp. TaxID=169970 RepID=UPI002594A8B7|nr:GNAT family N-acetyltransferase [uncultured Brevibacillus sp.]
MQEKQPEVHFRRIDAKTVLAICDLSDTLSFAQRKMVADNAVSIAQAHFSEQAWFRAIYADEEPIGFVMLHIASDYDDEIDVDGAFLWRFMIAGPHQGKGYGKQAIDLLINKLKAQGMNELVTSCGEGEDSPLAFYKRLGFTLNGDTFGDEIGLVIKF